MDGKVKQERKKHPRERANPLSIITFAFTLPTFWVGCRRDLEIADLYKPMKEHTSSYLGSKICRVWQKEYDKYEKQKSIEDEKHSNDKYNETKKVKEPSLTKVLIKCFGLQIMVYGIVLAVLEISLRLSQPLFLGLLIRYFNRMKYVSVPSHTVMTSLYNSSDSQAHKIEDSMKPLSP